MDTCSVCSRTFEPTDTITDIPAIGKMHDTSAHPECRALKTPDFWGKAEINYGKRKALLAELRGHIADRTRVNEQEAEQEGYCRHGKYVGGMGIDWMCHPCEMGDTIEDEISRHVDGLVYVAKQFRSISNALTQLDGKRVRTEELMRVHIKSQQEYLASTPYAGQVWDVLNETNFWTEV